MSEQRKSDFMCVVPPEHQIPPPLLALPNVAQGPSEIDILPLKLVRIRLCATVPILRLFRSYYLRWDPQRRRLISYIRLNILYHIHISILQWNFNISVLAMIPVLTNNKLTLLHNANASAKNKMVVMPPPVTHGPGAMISQCRGKGTFTFLIAPMF